MNRKTKFTIIKCLVPILLTILSFTSTYGQKHIPLSVSYIHQRTKYYAEYLWEVLEYNPDKSNGYAISINYSPMLSDNIVYLNLGLINSLQRQNGYSDYANAQIDHKLQYLKIAPLLSIRTKNWNTTGISANFEFGPQISFLIDNELNVNPPDNPYKERSFLYPEFKTITLDFVGQVSILFKLSNALFLTTGIRYDRTITSPNEEHVPWWGTSVDGVVMEHYLQNIGFMFGLTFAINNE